MKQIRFFATYAIAMIVLNSHLSAQNNRAACGWLVASKKEESSNPLLFALQKSAAQKKINEYLQDHRTQTNDTLYTLPVVVHVIHTGTAIGSPDNPTDADINGMVLSLIMHGE